jgi:hypothetical protein
VSSDHRVIIIVSADFAVRLERLAKAQPVWAVKTASTEAVADRVWAGTERSDNHAGGLTLFVAGSTAEESLLSVVDDVVLHTGPDSGMPAPEALEVLGTSATDRVRSVLDSLGFSALERTPDGFVARRETDGAA